MEILFTNAEGKHLRWDGLLWSSPDEPAAAALLNLEPLGWGSSHCSILDRARRQAEEPLGPVKMTEVDLTGMPEEDLGEDVISEEEELAGRGEAGQSGLYDGPTEESSQGGALTQAHAHLCGSLCADGPDDGDSKHSVGGTEWDDDWDKPERQWSAVQRWAAERQMILTDTGPERPGGREHNVRFDSESKLWTKFTKLGLAGFMVDWNDNGTPYLRNALPEEYLSRMIWQNNLVGDEVEFAGLWREGSGAWSLVITQPDVPGEPASKEEIEEGMQALGFVRMGWTGIGYEDSTSWRIGRMGVWDVHPANVVMGENGVIVPVDVIIAELPHGFPPCHFHPEVKLFKLSPKL
jgi:hypothetical protein